MQTVKYVYWQEEGMWLGYLEEFPDYWTQGETREELEENLRDLYHDLMSGEIPSVRIQEMGCVLLAKRILKMLGDDAPRRQGDVGKDLRLHPELDNWCIRSLLSSSAPLSPLCPLPAADPARSIQQRNAHPRWQQGRLQYTISRACYHVISNLK